MAPSRVAGTWLPALVAFTTLASLAVPAGATQSRSVDADSSGGLLAPRQLQAPAAARPATLVLPFTPLGDAEPAWLSEGVPCFVLEGIRATGRAVVERSRRDEALEDAGLRDETRFLLASAVQVARTVGASHVVTGTWRSEGARITVAARIVDVPTLKLVAEREVTGSVNVLGSLLGALVLDLAGPAGREAATRVAIESLASTPSAALHSWMQSCGEPDLAVQHLQSAIAAAPRFLPALVALSEAQLAQGDATSALATARKALEVAPDDARARRAYEEALRPKPQPM